MSVCDRQRLKHMTPRQVDLNLDTVTNRFLEMQMEQEKVKFKERFVEEELYQRQLQDERLKLIEKFKQHKEKNSQTLAKIM